MSMIRCSVCEGIVDSDAFPEGFLVTPETVPLPAVKQDHVFVCERCQDDISEAELELRTPK